MSNSPRPPPPKTKRSLMAGVRRASSKLGPGAPASQQDSDSISLKRTPTHDIIPPMPPSTKPKRGLMGGLVNGTPSKVGQGTPVSRGPDSTPLKQTTSYDLTSPTPPSTKPKRGLMGGLMNRTPSKIGPGTPASRSSNSIALQQTTSYETLPPDSSSIKSKRGLLGGLVNRAASKLSPARRGSSSQRDSDSISLKQTTSYEIIPPIPSSTKPDQSLASSTASEIGPGRVENSRQGSDSVSLEQSTSYEVVQSSVSALSTPPQPEEVVSPIPIAESPVPVAEATQVLLPLFEPPAAQEEAYPVSVEPTATLSGGEDQTSISPEHISSSVSEPAQLSVGEEVTPSYAQEQNMDPPSYSGPNILEGAVFSSIPKKVFEDDTIHGAAATTIGADNEEAFTDNVNNIPQPAITTDTFTWVSGLLSNPVQPQATAMHVPQPDDPPKPAVMPDTSAWQDTLRVSESLLQPADPPAPELALDTSEQQDPVVVSTSLIAPPPVISQVEVGSASSEPVQKSAQAAIAPSGIGRQTSTSSWTDLLAYVVDPLTGNPWVIPGSASPSPVAEDPLFSTQNPAPNPPTGADKAPTTQRNDVSSSPARMPRPNTTNNASHSASPGSGERATVPEGFLSIVKRVIVEGTPGERLVLAGAAAAGVAVVGAAVAGVAVPLALL